MNFDSLTKEGILDIDQEKYPFIALIRKVMECEDRPLNKLHETIPGGEETRLLTMDYDQCTDFHRKYYDSPLLPEVLALYERFVKEHIAPMFDDDVVVYQKRPTFRVHLPSNTAVPSDVGGDPDRPGLHRDSAFNHRSCEINFWCPFTPTDEMNTMYTESEPDKGDFHPILMEGGQVLRFWGAQVLHYNKINAGTNTRVSFDFRVAPLSKWDFSADVKNSVQTGRRFTIGEGEMDYFTTYDKRTGGKYDVSAEIAAGEAAAAAAAADAVDAAGDLVDKAPSATTPTTPESAPASPAEGVDSNPPALVA